MNLFSPQNEMAQLKVQMDELQNQIQKCKMVYKKLLRDKQLEREFCERIRKQYLQKQLELEYVFNISPLSF